MKKVINYGTFEKGTVILLLLFGIIVRCYKFGAIPGGLNQDEAFSAYEAYSLLHYGMDSSGYAFPVYFNAWGSGMRDRKSVV